MAIDLHRDSVVVFKCCGVVLLFCAWQFFQQPYAAIPAQDRIIVVGWLNFLRLFKIAHRFFKQPHKNMRGTPDRKSNTSELQSRGHLVCRLLLEKKKKAHTEEQFASTDVYSIPMI